MKQQILYKSVVIIPSDTHVGGKQGKFLGKVGLQGWFKSQLDYVPTSHIFLNIFFGR